MRVSRRADPHGSRTCWGRARLDDARRLPPSLVEALSETAVFRAFYPSALGGLQADPHTLYRAVEAIACVDGTVGW